LRENEVANIDVEERANYLGIWLLSINATSFVLLKTECAGRAIGEILFR